MLTVVPFERPSNVICTYSLFINLRLSEGAEPPSRLHRSSARHAAAAIRPRLRSPRRGPKTCFSQNTPLVHGAPVGAGDMSIDMPIRAHLYT